jgi:hypothetical protein
MARISLVYFTGWWFGTFGLCFHVLWIIIIPTDELIFFRGAETTNQFSLWWGYPYFTKPPNGQHIFCICVSCLFGRRASPKICVLHTRWTIHRMIQLVLAVILHLCQAQKRANVYLSRK